jgi:hypothetical protein
MKFLVNVRLDTQKDVQCSAELKGRYFVSVLNECCPCPHLTDYTSPTHHITTSSITPYALNNFNYQCFNHYPFLTYIYIIYVIFTVIITIFNFNDVTATQLTTFVPLCSCNNITLKMAEEAAETCW